MSTLRDEVAIALSRIAQHRVPTEDDLLFGATRSLAST